MTEGHRLMEDFNDYYHKTAYFRQLKAKGHYIRGFKETPERLQALERMAAWCRARHLDPRHWLQSLFESRRWTFAPQWNQLISEKHLTRYPSLPVSQPYQAKILSEWQAGQMRRNTNFDVNRDLSPVTEALKARYLNFQETDRCLAQMQQETMGYHPKSAVCARCPRARECEQRLRALARFDIVALRMGMLSMEQATIQERQTYYEPR